MNVPAPKRIGTPLQGGEFPLRTRSVGVAHGYDGPGRWPGTMLAGALRAIANLPERGMCPQHPPPKLDPFLKISSLRSRLESSNWQTRCDPVKFRLAPLGASGHASLRPDSKPSTSLHPSGPAPRSFSPASQAGDLEKRVRFWRGMLGAHPTFWQVRYRPKGAGPHRPRPTAWTIVAVGHAHGPRPHRKFPAL